MSYVFFIEYYNSPELNRIENGGELYIINMKRKPISKKAKFEILKRDSFKCQYCGKEAPAVILEVDHIRPVCKGGSNDLFNLITACYDCNRGKAGIPIKNQDILKKQKTQLNEINKKREQLLFLKKWKEELENYEDEECNFFIEHLVKFCDSYELNESGRRKLKKWIKKYTTEELINAIQISFERYFDNQYSNEEQKKQKWNLAFNKIPAIIENKKKESELPHLKEIYYCRGILKNRLNYFDGKKAMYMLVEYYNTHKDLIKMKEICLNSKNWTHFREQISNN